MQYGICHLSIIPVRLDPDGKSEMVTQLVYGDHFKVLEKRKEWSKIRIAFDAYEGWMDNNQFNAISEGDFKKIENSAHHKFVSDLVSFAEMENKVLIPIVLGSSVQHIELLSHSYQGGFIDAIKEKSQIMEIALLYLNAPYLSGGKTPFGLDCSGFTQMVYKIAGYKLPRDISQQAAQGDSLSFIEESDAADLAFFDNVDGKIDHVGIIMKNNRIIHAYGKVRIDRIDHTGIFNSEIKGYTHKLRVIKKIL